MNDSTAKDVIVRFEAGLPVIVLVRPAKRVFAFRRIADDLAAKGHPFKANWSTMIVSDEHTFAKVVSTTSNPEGTLGCRAQILTDEDNLPLDWEHAIKVAKRHP